MVGRSVKNWTILLLGFILVFIILPPYMPEYVLIVFTRVLILSIVAMSLDILIGYSGIGAIGHAAFFAIGGYTAALLFTRLHASFGITLIASIGLASVVSAVAGLLMLRATGIFLLIISLAISMCIWGLLFRWVSLTGGESGITDIARPALAFFGDISRTTDFYYFILIIFAMALFIMFLLVNSLFGKILVGIRDSESRMKVLGYNVWRQKYLAIIIAGAFAGLSGNLYVMFNKFISPDYANLGTCFDFVLMVIIGGPGTLVGSILGSVIVAALKEFLSVYFSRWLMFLGIVYILTAVYAPKGILGLIHHFFWEEKHVSSAGENGLRK